jgi:hypothetical protein
MTRAMPRLLRVPLTDLQPKRDWELTGCVEVQMMRGLRHRMLKCLSDADVDCAAQARPQG